LRIDTQGAAARWFPLRLISRIQANEHSQFSTPALLACARAGISLVFLDEAGSALARVLGTPGERQELRQRLLDFLSRPDWQDLYSRWRWATEWWVINAVRPRLGCPERLTRREEVYAWIRFAAQQHCTAAEDAASRRWLGEIAWSWMSHHAQQLGFGAQSELALDGHPDLIRDLAAMHGWHLEPLRLGWLRQRAEGARRSGRPPQPLARRQMLALYENNSARLALAGRELTHRLHLWLVELC
jgi:hypothetical protein